jgi:hypothetical protein
LPNYANVLKSGGDRAVNVDRAVHLHDIRAKMPDRGAEVANLPPKSKGDSGLRTEVRYWAQTMQVDLHGLDSSGGEPTLCVAALAWKQNGRFPSTPRESGPES